MRHSFILKSSENVELMISGFWSTHLQILDAKKTWAIDFSPPLSVTSNKSLNPNILLIRLSFDWILFRIIILHTKYDTFDEPCSTP